MRTDEEFNLFVGMYPAREPHGRAIVELRIALTICSASASAGQHNLRQVRGCQVRLPRDRYCSVERARPQLLMVCATGWAAIAELRVAVSRGVQNSTPFRMLRDPRHGLAGLQVAPHDVLPGQGLKDCMLKFA